MTQRTQYLFRCLAVAALLAALLYWTRDQWDELDRVWALSPLSLLLLSALFILYQIVAGLVLKIFVGVFGIGLAPWEWFGLICIRSLGNYFPLNAGWTANALYLKVRRDFPISSFAVLMAGNLVLALLTAGLMGLGLLALHYLQTDSFQPLLTGLYGGVVVAAVAILAVPLPRVLWEGRIGAFLRAAHDGWNLLRSHRRLTVQVVSLQVLGQLVAGVQYVIACRELDIELSLAPILILSISTTVIQFATLVPGNLGIREAIAGAIAAAFGVPFSAGFLAAALTRIVNTLWILVLGGYFALRFPLGARRPD